MDRKKFITNGLIGSGILLSSPMLLAQVTGEEFDTDEISEFVFAAHNDVNKVRKIVEEKPLILNCTNQAGKGDFETAIGGASHMGRRDIADLLVSKGARLDIFSYAFLGYDDFIKKQLSDYPHLINSPGPHGFTLLHHAKVGKRLELTQWLQDKGLTETRFKSVFK
jgi:ankyrin repeat protein